jgi:acetyl-CoA carboxylase biotin carboxyl carrier protein
MAANAEKQRTEKRPRAVSAAAEQLGNGTVAGSGQPMMDLAFLRGLIEAVDQSGIDSLEIHRAGTRIRIAKTPAPAPVHTLAAAHGLMPTPALAPSVPPAAAPSTVAPGSPEAAGSATSHLVDIKSPMVGTFYRSPAPEAPAYVEIGTHVSKGQTLCILEAMKLMNELESEVDGVVREVLVDNADPVEYGQVLFRIEPSGR